MFHTSSLSHRVFRVGLSRLSTLRRRPVESYYIHSTYRPLASTPIQLPSRSCTERFVIRRVLSIPRSKGSACRSGGTDRTPRRCPARNDTRGLFFHSRRNYRAQCTAIPPVSIPGLNTRNENPARTIASRAPFGAQLRPRREEAIREAAEGR